MAGTQRFDQRVAVVTGGASGIGLAITRRLAAEGARVVIGDINAEQAERVCRELGPTVIATRVDVRVESDVAAMVALAVERFGALDLAFNSAGLGTHVEIVDMPVEEWDKIVDICLKGVFLCVKHQGRAMRESGRGGAIVNVASLNSRVPSYGGAAYAAAKAGVAMLSSNAALELAPDRIRVNAISPGLTETQLTTGVHQIPELDATFIERIPLGRWATPEDIAAPALYLASDDAAYVTGINMFVDGGWEMTAYPDLRPYSARLGGWGRPR